MTAFASGIASSSWVVVIATNPAGSTASEIPLAEGDSPRGLERVAGRLLGRKRETHDGQGGRANAKEP